MCSYCNHTHSFVSAHTTVYVCPQCHRMLQKGIVYKENQPEEALRVEEDMSLLRLGSVLVYQSLEYTVIGRFQYFFNGGVRSKWLLRNSADELLYVIEQAGFYGVCKKHDTNLSRYELSGLAPGYEFVVGENTPSLFLESLFNNHSTRMEGELCEVELNAKELIAADFTNEAGGYAFAQVFDKMNNTVFVGECYDFNQLQLTNTRLTDEWK